MAEWLSHITVDTTYQDVLNRPSAFNPEPGFIDREFEVTPSGIISNASQNSSHVIRYSNGRIYEAVWPVAVPVWPGAPVHRLDTPSPENNRRLRGVSITDFEKFDAFWERQASLLSHRKLLEHGKPFYDKYFRRASEYGAFSDPRRFLQFSTRAFEHSLANEMPATAYAIAQTAFTGVVRVNNETVRCHGLRRWLDDYLTHIVEPGVSHAVHNAYMRDGYSPHKTAQLNRLRRDIATRTVDIAQHHWAMRSLMSAEEVYADKSPKFTEKIIWHQINVGRQAILATQDLAQTITAVPESIRSTNALPVKGQTPQQIGTYVMNTMY